MDLPSGPRVSQEELTRRVTRIIKRRDRTTGKSIPFPKLHSVTAHPLWVNRVETDLKVAGIPQRQWSDAATIILDPKIRTEIRKLKRRRVYLGVYWPWDDFKESLLDVLIECTVAGCTERDTLVAPVAATPGDTSSGGPAVMNPATPGGSSSGGPNRGAMIAGAGLVIAGATVLAPAVVIAAGFTSGGVAAGSLAASLQSIFYGGATSGLFSIFQSIGATAVAPSLGASMVAVKGIVAGVNLMSGSNSRDEDGDGDDSGSDVQDGPFDQDGPGDQDNDEKYDSSDEEDWLPTAPVATDAPPTPSVLPQILIGPMNWGVNTTGSVRTLIFMTPNCNEIDTTMLRASLIYRKDYVSVTGLSLIDAATFSNNFSACPPPGFKRVSVILLEA